MKNCLFFVIPIILFSACVSGWSDEYKQMYKDQCKGVLTGIYHQDSITKYCECALEKIMLAYPNQADAIENSHTLDTVPGIEECKERYWLKYK